MDTAKDIGPSGWDKYSGAGIIQAKKAFEKLRGVITPPPKKICFIATAAYGSELEPPVQFLREFRDDVVLPSWAGDFFRNTLEVYYTFSPPIAELMKRNNLFKLAMKYIVVWPFVGLARITAFLIKPFVKL